MAVKVSWPQALAWRLHRHLLDPVGTKSIGRDLGAAVSVA